MTISLHSVNKQLALFFDQVGITNYPKKSIESLTLAFFVIAIHLDIISILGYNFEIPKIYFCLSVWLNNLLYQAVRLAVTGAFFFLADFTFETRTRQARSANLQDITDMNINKSNLMDCTEPSLMGNNLLEP